MSKVRNIILNDIREGKPTKVGTSLLVEAYKHAGATVSNIKPFAIQLTYGTQEAYIFTEGDTVLVGEGNESLRNMAIAFEHGIA